MKKVININFQGRVVPIEETAYDILKQYVESLRHFFANEEGKDEIINDIEGRIGELFGETLKKGSTCITDDDVNAIIKSMGRPEDFEADEANVKSQLGSEKQQSYTSSASAGSGSGASAKPHRLYRDENNKFLGGVCAGIANYFGIDRLIVRILFVLGFGITFIPYLILWVAVPSSASIVIGAARKRLFRDPDNKWIAGVCGGLASYFGVNVWIPRVLFLIPFLTITTNWNHWGIVDFPTFLSLSFSPGSILVYIILWLVLPVAQTTSDKLEMKGEKVDLTSIKNTIQQDMEGFKDRAQEFGKEVGVKAQQIGTTIGEQGKKFSSEAGTVVKKTGTTVGDIIVLLFKIFAYFILAVVLLAIVGTLFGLGIAFTSLLPIKGYFLTDGLQNMLAWGTFIFFIWVPVIGIITWIIRRIARVRSNSNTMRFIFIALWIVGWFCAVSLIASLSNDFKYHNAPVEQSVTLNRPSVNKLELRFIKDNRYYFNNSWLHLEPFATLDEDTAFVKNIHVRILKSTNDSFHVTVLKLVNGESRQEAEVRAQNINFNIIQNDTTLLFDRGIPVTKTDKFRNQAVYVTVYVPVNKTILVKDYIGWGNDMHWGFHDAVDDWHWRYDEEGYNWENNVEYIMTQNGLKPLYPSGNDEDNNDNLDEDEKNKQNAPVDTLRKNNDSSRYHYQPSKKTDSTSSEMKVFNRPETEAGNKTIDIHDMPLSFLGRTAI